MINLHTASSIDSSIPFQRVTVIVLDSVGCGALPDAGDYGDAETNTLLNLSKAVGGLSLPTLESMGLGCVADIAGLECVEHPTAACARLALKSPGKDTTTGHWEMMGLPLESAFPVYPNGFPPEVMDKFSSLTGYGYLGNYPASGTEIIDQLGQEHLSTGKLIVYTSADSVFQIAAHEHIVPLAELYRICELVRTDILVGDHAVARVIARPFAGDAETGFYRTPNRHDYSVKPFGPTVLDALQAQGVHTIGVGKISDIFSGQGVSTSLPTTDNTHGMALVEQLIRDPLSDEPTFVFANLVDFDMKWGHRRDCAGYADGLTAFDQWLREIIPLLTEQDYLIITADHGCDPTHVGSDHTREWVPYLGYTPGKQGRVLDPISTLAFVGDKVLECFAIPKA